MISGRSWKACHPAPLPPGLACSAHQDWAHFKSDSGLAASDLNCGCGQKGEGPLFLCGMARSSPRLAPEYVPKRGRARHLGTTWEVERIAQVPPWQRPLWEGEGVCWPRTRHPWGSGEDGWLASPPSRDALLTCPWPRTPWVALLFGDSIYICGLWRGAAQVPVLTLSPPGYLTLHRSQLPCATVFSLSTWEKQCLRTYVL